MNQSDLKIVTWNVNSLKVRLPQLLDFLKEEAPDIVGIQELKCDNEAFPLLDIEAAGYQVSFNGQKTYNGVALLSKMAQTDVLKDIPDFEDIQKRVIAATINGIRIINLYVVNGQDVNSDKFEYKLKWLCALQAWLKVECSQHEKILVMGDFNIAPEDCDVHDPKLWKDKVLCTVNERDAFQQILKLGLSDSFRLSAQPQNTFSWWDYRNQGFERNDGVRIDHLLISTPLNAQFKSCQVMLKPRQNERPSDHAPVMLTLSQRL
jgi:exodeoxyribonuclease-3